MMTFDINNENDIYLSNRGNLAVVTAEKAVKNVCAHYAKALRGEMIHKIDKGMPFWKTTFGRQSDIPLFESVFRERMSEISDVIAVSDFTATLTDNTLSYQAEIQTQYGEITLNG